MSDFNRISSKPPIAEVSPLDISPINKTHPSAVDTLETSKISSGKEKHDRPRLTPPAELPQSSCRFLGVLGESHSTNDKIMDNFAVRLSIGKEKVREIQAENIQKLRENSERAKNSDWWSALQKIASCLLAAMSIVFGASLGTWVGGAMIASGIISLANFALIESHAWDYVAKQLSNDNEEWRKKLAKILPAALGLVAAGFGLAGAIRSVATGAVPFAEKAMYIAQSALSLFDSLTTIGKGQSDARLLWQQAQQSETQAKLTIERTQFDALVGSIEGALSDFKASKAAAKKTVQMITNSNIQLVRQA